jgi:hypothetical protein
MDGKASAKDKSPSDALNRAVFPPLLTILIKTRPTQPVTVLLTHQCHYLLKD